MKRKILALLLICLGLCSCVSGAMLWQGNNAESEEAGEAAERVSIQLAAEISAAAETGEHAGPYFAPYYAPLMEAVPEMPTAVVEDSIWLGQIEIPALGISLPVLSEYTESGLRSAPCRYSGSCYTNDIVICAHNYASFFDKLLGVSVGTEVLFTDCSGHVWHYLVANRETLGPDAVEEMTGPSDDWDMTLFTCHFGGRTRCAVRCILNHQA